MLIALFIFEIVILCLTILTTHMVEHKFKNIQASLDMYCNKRTYKTKADIDFIESIITSYQKLAKDTDEEPDLESAIKRKLQHEYIGRFAYVSVKNVAMKVKNLMWGGLILEMLIAWVNHMSSDGQAVIIITASLLLTVMMSIYVIIKGVDEKSEALVDEVIHYIRNIYPLEQKKQKGTAMSAIGCPISLEAHKEKKEERVKKQLENRVDKEGLVKEQAEGVGDYQEKQRAELTNVVENLNTNSSLNLPNEYEKNSDGQEVNKKEELSAKDIAKLLNSL